MPLPARLCRAAAATQPATLQRALRALLGARDLCTRPRACPQAAPHSRWQPAGSGGGGSGGARLVGVLQQRQQLHSSHAWRARAFSEADIKADVGVMIEGEPAGMRCVLASRVRTSSCRQEALCHSHSRGPGRATLHQFAQSLLHPLPCSEAQLEQLCEQLYADGLAVAKQAVLYVLAEEEEEREEPPGGCCACFAAAAYSAWRFCCIPCSGLVAVQPLEC